MSKTVIAYTHTKPIPFGLFVVLYIVFFVAITGFATGVVTPTQVFAEILPSTPAPAPAPAPVLPPTPAPPPAPTPILPSTPIPAPAPVLPPPEPPVPIFPLSPPGPMIPSLPALPLLPPPPPPVIPLPVIPLPVIPAVVDDGDGGGGGGNGNGGGGTSFTPVCTLIAAPTSIAFGSTSILSWTTANASTFSLNQSIGLVTPAVSGSTTTPSISADTTFTGTATGAGGSMQCTAIVTMSTGGSGGGGGGGGGGGSGESGSGGGGGGGGSGGGGSPSPTITLAVLPYVGVQPLAYLYLSQIPYTGLDLGPAGTIIYWLVLVGAMLALAYFIFFYVAPFVNRSARNFSFHVKTVLNARAIAPIAHATSSPMQERKEISRGYSSYDGFKSFAQNGALSIEDIVKSLSRGRSVHNVEPVYNNVEPIYENVEPIVASAGATVEASTISALVRAFTVALFEGDRVAVFAALRQYIQSGGAPEQLITATVCLLDDAYRARIDGTASDPALARVIARLNTHTLEKIIAALTTAIDSSYSTGVTGAKLALIRALAVLGA